jgi:hypothetical protein
MRKTICSLIFLLAAAIALAQSGTVKIDHYEEYPGVVQIPVEIAGFDNVGAIDLNFEYDPDVLLFTGYNGAISGMEANAHNINGAPVIGITWSAPGASGVDFPDGVLINIEFTYVSGTANLTFVESFCQVIDNDFNPFNILYINGSISPKGFAQVEIPDVTGLTPNTQVNVPLNVDFSDITDGVSSFELVIDFDQSVLSYNSFINPALTNLSVTDVSSSRISVSWLNPGSNGSDLNGKLLDLVFDYSIGASDLSFVEELSSMGDNNGLDVNVVYDDGSVTQDPATIAQVTAGKITASGPNITVDVPIDVDFSGIANGVGSFNFTIEFAASALQYQEILNTALTGLSVEVISASRIDISWFNPDPTGSLLNGKLLDIRFAFSGGHSDITFNTTLSQMGDNNALDVNVAFTDGWVTQDPATIVEIIAATVDDATPGQSVDLPVTVRNFNDIGGFTFFLDFDGGVLEFDQVKNLHPDLSSLLANPIGNNQISLIWADDALTLADDTKLFDLTFDFIAGQSDLVFDLAECEVSDGSAISLFANYTDGFVGEELPPAISVTIAEVLAQPGIVDVPASVIGFNNIGAFDLVINYDPNRLTFSGLENIAADIANDGELLYNENAGQIFIGWNVDPAATAGLTMADEEKLFDLRFDYLGSNTDITFETNDCAISDFDFEALNVAYIDGGVRGAINLELTVFLEGLYNATAGQMNKAMDYDPVLEQTFPKYDGTVADLITVELHVQGNYGSPVHIVEDVELHQDGTAAFSIPNQFSSSYYITILHRNHLETVSGAPVSLASPQVSYNFTTEDTQAFGDNMKEVATGVWGIYAGDVNGDGVLSGADLVAATDQVRLTATGYRDEDVNGDGVMSGSDIVIITDNIRLTISSQTPD